MHLNDKADTKHFHTHFQNATSMFASQFCNNFLQIFEHQLYLEFKYSSSFLRSDMFFPELDRQNKVKRSLIFLTFTFSQRNSVEWAMIYFCSLEAWSSLQQTEVMIQKKQLNVILFPCPCLSLSLSLHVLGITHTMCIYNMIIYKYIFRETYFCILYG